MSTPAGAATPAGGQTRTLAEGRPPDHVDRDGPWWVIQGMERWWVREGADGACVARDRYGQLGDVTAPNSYLIGVFAQHEVIRLAHRRWFSFPAR